MTAPDHRPGKAPAEEIDGVDRAKTIITRLARQLDPDGSDTEFFETHISLVLLSGERALKIKKPVDLGFLDFSTLEARRYYCERELELNRRYAPGLYKRVFSVTGTPQDPQVDGDGPVIEYGLEMQRFPTAARFDVVLEAGQATVDDVIQLAADVAALHASGAVGDPNETYGDPLLVEMQLMRPFATLVNEVDVAPIKSGAERLLLATAPFVERRRAEHHVRDCHGDLHLSNVVRIDGRLVAFDCIEFDDSLRFIDTASDIAFMLMDLDVRGHHGLAAAFLNSYLSSSGDYSCLQVLRLYCVYRTVVRAMVAHLEAPKGGDAFSDKRDRHLRLAQRYLEPRPASGVIITHGLSGSGKTYWSSRLATRCGYIHIRSDIERRRLAGLAPEEASGSGVADGLYTAASSAHTYDELLRLAREIVSAGYTVIVDATFLQREQREAFRTLAAELAAPFHLLNFEAPQAVLEQRIRERASFGRDASEATIEVLHYQQRVCEPVQKEEHAVSAGSVLSGVDDPTVRAAEWGAGRLID